MGPIEVSSSAGGWTRRSFLQRSSAAAVGTLLWASWGEEWALAFGVTDDNSISFRLVRDADLLQAEIRFIRFRREGEAAGSALRPAGFGDSLIALRLPPQNLGEAIFDEVHKTAGLENDYIPSDVDEGSSQKEGKYSPQAPVPSLLSGPSWLVYAVPNDASFPLNDVGRWFELLSRCNLRVPRSALPYDKRGMMTPHAPGLDETRLEIPFRLFIAPEPETRTQFSDISAFSPDGFQELWQAALESRVEVRSAPPPPDIPNLPEELKPPREAVLHARAVWSPDYRSESEPPLSLYYPGFQPLSLHALTRHRLVKQMCDGNGWIDAEHLILTALGADVSFHYATQKPVNTIIKEQIDEARGIPMPTPIGTELAIWKHRIVIGRDVYFAEAYVGFLLPFAYSSIYVEITKRKPAATLALPDRVGFSLLKRRFILVQESIKAFAGSDNPLGRSMPIKNVRMITTRSPDLEAPTDIGGTLHPKPPAGFYFWPREIATGKEVDWEFEGEDEEEQNITSTHARLLFATNIVYGHQLYSMASAEQRTMRFDGSKLAFSRETPQVYVPAPLDAANAVPISIKTDRATARFLTEAAETLRAQVEGARVPAAAELKKTIDSARDEAVRKYNLAEAEVGKVAGELKAALDRISSWSSGENYGAIVRSLREGMERAEKISSSMATEAITFASRFVEPLVRAVRELEKGVEAALAKGDTAKVIAALQALVTAAELPNEVAALKTGSLLADLKGWLSDLVRQAEALGRSSLRAKASVLTDEQIRAFVRGKLNELLESLRELEKELAGIGSPFFHAVMEEAGVTIPALKDVLPDCPKRQIAMLEQYVAGGIENVRQGIFARLTDVVDTGQKLAEGVKNGVVQPAAIIGGLSREIGAVVAEGRGKLDDLAQQIENFDISSAIPDSKLFGVVSLRSLLKPLLGRGELPKIQMVELPDKIERNWEWVASLDHEKGFGPLTVKFPRNSDSRLAIYSRATLHLPPAGQLAEGKRPQADLELRGWLGGWKPQGAKFEDRVDTQRMASPQEARVVLNLLQLIEVNFAYVSFKANYREGEPFKPDLDPKFIGVDFLGPLQFLAKLQDFLKGLTGGLEIDVQPAHLQVGSEVQLPPVSFGFFSLRCMRLEQSLLLPFGGTPLNFRFSFASFARPFELSVMGFAGRGYFSAAIWSDGRRQLEGALEFGGSLSFDVGVASGGLYVMAGAYFKLTNSETTLSGYLRAGGNLEVIKIIHASVEFLLMVSYRRAGSQSELYGTCTVTVSIDLFFFSADVHITMERRIAGSGGGGGERAATATLNPARAGAPVLAAAPAPAASSMPYIRRAHSGPGQFASYRDWRRKYWDHFAS